MSTIPGYLLYKCRLCGEVEKNLLVADGPFALMLLLDPPLRRRSMSDLVPSVLQIHYCGDGRRGIADLIGFEEDNTLAEEMSRHINQLDEPEKIILNKRDNVVKAAGAFMDQLNSFNDFYHPEVHRRALELQKAVGELYA